MVMRTHTWATAAILVTALASCGGGGGGGNQGPDVPLGLAANINGGVIELTWDSSDDATAYRIYYDLEPGVSRAAFALVTEVPHDALSAVQGADLTAGPSFRGYFAVTTVEADGDESALSTEVSAATAVSSTADPLFSHQWHLLNTGQQGGTNGEDAAVTAAWTAGFDGTGVRIAIVDDGLEIGHEDLFLNCPPGESHNYLNGTTDPTGGAHGTSCGGVAAAVGGNDVGLRGAAPEAFLVGYNLLQSLTSSNEANAMTRDMADNWISSNSWGAPDGLGVPQPSRSTWRSAVTSGLQNGRDGLGLIYLWAAGNGGLAGGDPGDNSNYDGQANYYGVIAVGAVGDDGVKASYSEDGANLLVCAPSMGRANHGISTVDRTAGDGYNAGGPPDFVDPDYTNTFNGTSSATPLAAGVVALMLDANPALTWRDVRLVLARSARKNHPGDAGWLTNGAGLLFNHKYGFGVVDAQAAVNLAQTWTNVGPLLTHLTPTQTVNMAIPDADPVTGVSSDITIAGSGINAIEHVEIIFDADNHTYVGDLLVFLESPSGSFSVLSVPHNITPPNVPYNNWVFGSNVHLDEPADGTWTLTVRDVLLGDTGTFRSWRLRIRGRS